MLVTLVLNTRLCYSYSVLPTCLTLLGTKLLKTVEVQTEYLDYFTRNIKSFGSSSICVVKDIYKAGKRALKISTQ